MSNPTSNFGWVMPTSTDLVTDLPADFAVFGQGVDTTMADLKGGTTGQVLSKATNTDMDFTWVSPNPGDITAVNVTSPITGGGSSGDVTIGIQAGSTTQSGAVQLTDSTSSTSTTTAATPNAVKTSYDLANAAIPKSTATAKGNIFTATAASTPAVLAVGANNTVLTADSSTATGLKWATPTSGGMTSIASGSLTGSSVVLSSISGSYKNLQLVLRNFTFSGTQNNIKITANSITSYTYQYLYSSTVNTVLNGYDIANAQVYLAANSLLQTTTTPTAIINIFDYADTTAYKLINTVIQGTRHDNSTQMVAQNIGAINSTAAITSLTIGTNGNNFSTGTYTLYGVS